jgi:ABC-type nitrate/sulfonate/bicarbonate transport system substrate-binding protein
MQDSQARTELNGVKIPLYNLIGALVLTLSFYGATRAAELPTKAVFAYGAINAYMTSTWIAKDLGLFRKHSVDVDPVFIIAGRLAPALLSGDVHVGLLGPTHVTNAVAAGGDLVMFMGNQNRVRYTLVVHSSIKRGEDLKGKKIAIGASQAGLASLATHAALDHMGLNAKRDNVTLLLIGEEPLRLAALQTGNVQATLVGPELANTVSGQGFPTLLDVAKLNIPFQASGMVTTRRLLRSDPILLERIGRASVEAIHYLRNSSNKKSVLQIMQNNLKLANVDCVEASYRELVDELPRNICPTVAGLRSVMKLMAELGLNPKAAQMKPDDVTDPTLCKSLGGEAS